MNFQKELERVGTDLFTDAFLERVTDAARCHLEEYFSVSEEELLTGLEELRDLCDAHQHEVLEKIENLYQEQSESAVKYGFARGVFVAFQQYYGQDTVRLSPYDLTGTELIKIDRFYWDEKSRKRKEEIEELLYETFYTETGAAGDQNTLKTDSNMKKSAIMVDLGWKERLLDVIRHGIMLGYRGALWTIQMAGKRDYTLNMISNILRTEYELGFTQMLEDRERTEKKR